MFSLTQNIRIVFLQGVLGLCFQVLRVQQKPFLGHASQMGELARYFNDDVNIFPLCCNT